MRRANVVTAASALAFACVSEPAQHAPPLWLSQTRLYEDIEEKRVADDMLAYEPAFALWSDGAHKRRWLYLPKGTRIGSADMDHWQFPIGATAFKEFSRDGKRIETRMIERVDETTYRMQAFVWNEDESDARYTPSGQSNAKGSGHDVPSSAQCATCHNGEPGKLLGFSAVQQPKLSSFTPPGDALTAKALGYLHANCAHCHNPNGSARPDTNMNLRLYVHDRDVHDTAAYRTALDQAVQSFAGSSFAVRVTSSDPDHSALLHRMRSRDAQTQMPPIGTRLADAEGITTVRAWIASLTPRPASGGP